ncbi:hypothetical protein CBR_g22942 [Chara braunii]|uniref:CCHC-type domain-containing protein n=1 Tax=Chara braunii TaxID=69332 RepID=A0A388L341_CHABU|nr:hypothetical protein CBR_g22942 [Chara braunii]|eukprot:GBG76724.1 hypothetical protein CBR_g22942 [Chara braunii]
MYSGGPQVCHHCKQPGHFVRDCQLRQVPNVVALLGGNGGAPAQDNDGLLSTPNAIVPYRPPAANGGQNKGSRHNSNHGTNQGNKGYNNQGYDNGYNQGYSNNYGRTGYQQRPRNNWWTDNREREKNERFDKVWGWFSEEMENKDKERRAKEEKLEEEEEKRKVQAAEEERAKAKKERKEFERSLERMVKDNMKEVCQEVLGKKASTSRVSTAGCVMEARRDETRSDEGKRKEQDDRWRREDSAAREQLEKQRMEEMERLRKDNDDLIRMASQLWQSQ